MKDYFWGSKESQIFCVIAFFAMSPFSGKNRMMKATSVWGE
jgi:hypothetical protein